MAPGVATPLVIVPVCPPMLYCAFPPAVALASATAAASGEAGAPRPCVAAAVRLVIGSGLPLASTPAYGIIDPSPPALAAATCPMTPAAPCSGLIAVTLPDASNTGVPPSGTCGLNASGF